MSAIFPALVASLCVVPIFLSIVAFKIHFPKHTLRVSDSHLVPLGMGFLLLLVITAAFYHLSSDLVQLETLDSNQLLMRFSAAILRNRIVSAIHFAVFIFGPPGFVWAFSGLLYYCWTVSSHFNAKIGWYNPKWMLILVGRATGNLVVNYMAQITEHDERTCAKMVDILDNSDSMYSGIYREYHMEDGKLASISLSHVIRYAFKGETARKEAIARGDKDSFVPYILPHTGYMVFKMDQIQNFHFWTIEKNQTFRFDLNSKVDQARVAWFSGVNKLKYWLNLELIAKVPVEGDLSVLSENLNKLNLSKLASKLIKFDFAAKEGAATLHQPAHTTAQAE